jgi:TolB protein
MKPDGSNVRELTRTPPPLLYLGSPEWSADGKKICFDASNGPTTTSHIFVINVDGSGLTDLGPGCMPSFSPDCKRIVFSLPGQGIVMMDADGGNRQIVDRQGWGVQWSPDGKYLAYGLAGNVMLMDVRTGEKRPLLVGADASKFGYVYWNLGWSNDSRAVAFKAQNRQTRSEEIAVVEIGSPNSLKVLLTNFRGVNADITFLPGDRKILFSRNMSGQAGARLFTVDRDAGGTVELFPNQPMDYKLMNCDWSPDGEWIAITTEYPPEPVEWSTTQTTASQ